MDIHKVSKGFSIKIAGAVGCFRGGSKRHVFFMTSITQTFSNYKFEIAHFKAGRWMGEEEEKAGRQKEAGGGGRGELPGTCWQSTRPDFKAEE